MKVPVLVGVDVEQFMTELLQYSDDTLIRMICRMDHAAQSEGFSNRLIRHLLRRRRAGMNETQWKAFIRTLEKVK